MAAKEAEKDYVRSLAQDLVHFPAAIIDEKIAQAVYHAFGHSLDQEEIHEWVEPKTAIGGR